MPRKKELPAPDSGEQDDLFSAEPQELPDTPLTEPLEKPIPTESPPDESAPDEDAPSEDYTVSSGAERISHAGRTAACSI